MYHKIWCDEESWKVFEFWGQLNKASKTNFSETVRLGPV